MMRSALPRRVLFAFLCALTLVPVSLIVGVLAFPEQLRLYASMPLCLLAVLLACSVLRGKVRTAAGFAGMAAVAAAGWFLLPVRTQILSALIPLAALVLLLIALPQQAPVRRGRVVSVTGALLYLIAYLLAIPKRGIPSGMEAVLPPLRALFCVYLVLWVFQLNLTALDDAVTGKRRMPVGIRRRNRLYSAALLVLVFLIGSLPAIAAFLRRAVSLAWDGVRALARLIDSLFMPSETGPVAGNGPAALSAMGGEIAEQSLFSVILEKILQVLVIAALAAGVLFLLWKLLKKLKPLATRLWAALNRYSAAVSEDYTDEITDTRRSEDRVSRTVRPLLRRILPVNEARLTPTERIRLHYRRLRTRHPEWAESSTARDTLAASAASLYESARYSARPATSEEADRFAAELKKR